MAHIKCRYSIPYCTVWGRWDQTRLEWDEFSFCSDESECETHPIKYERPKDADPMLVNPICRWAERRKGEFEKTVRRYEYTDESGLYFNDNEYYLPSDIDYLEIDGRILVGGDDHE